LLLNFGSTTFESDFTAATRDDGLTVRFTRSERLLLLHMQKNAGRLLSRSQLLDATSEPGSDKSDRTIDFVITRLRHKLNDDVTEPRFIATRYGEGYVWVATLQKPSLKGAGAHLVLGPIRIFGDKTQGVDHIDRLIGALQSELSDRLGAGLEVVLLPDCPPRSQFGENPPRYSADLTFINLDNRKRDCVVTVHEFALGKLISVNRFTTDAEDDLSTAAEMAARITADIWHSSLRDPNQIEPVVISLNNASIALTGDPGNWQENDSRLRSLLADQPDDPVVKVLLATNIQSKYVIGGAMAFMQPETAFLKDEDEIEALVTSALPLLQNDPTHALAAARLIFFLNRGYGPLAIEIAERSHRLGTSVAASYAAIGHMQVYLGDAEAGIAALDMALQMTTPNTQYEIYLQVVKSQALHAMGDREALQQLTADLYARLPDLQYFLEIYYSPQDDPSPAARMAVQNMPPAMATATLLFGHYIYARHFVQRDHRQTALGPAVRLLCGQFGTDVLPEVMRREYGHLVEPSAAQT